MAVQHLLKVQQAHFYRECRVLAIKDKPIKQQQQEALVDKRQWI